ncbi:MMPL family transporter [Streptomyces sp. NPDC050560]|uniref:MMPL family transporter n=1 Tax=Streptomyces sp. NPDC050560 TaxID=3365630 RepID=UPI0037BB20BA
MAGRLYAWARWVVRRRGRVVAVWLLMLVVIGGLGITLHGKISTEFDVPGVESQQAQDLLKKQFPEAAGGVSRVVFEAPEGDTLATPEVRAAIGAGLKRAARVPHVIQVADPSKTGTVSRDRTIGYADVRYDDIPQNVPESSKDDLSRAMDPARDAGITVEFGGSASTPPVEVGGPAEVIGVVVAFVVLAVALGSLLAAGMPLVTALVGVGIGVLGVQFVSRFIEMTNTATVLALMLGLAVGIDYALFIVSRHREQLAEPGSDVRDSIARATATAGSAVVFAGVTVVVALAALSAVGVPFLTVMGLAAAATVLVAILVALSLVPAVLALAGERLRPRRGRVLGRRSAEGGAPGAWGLAWGRAVTRAPLLFLLVPVVALLAVAAPAHGLRLGLPSNETQPVSSTQHKSYDLLAKGFGPGFNATLIVVADLHDVPTGQRAGVVKQLAGTVAKDPGVATVTPPTANKERTVSVVGLVPKTGPDATATSDMVHRLRDHGTGAVTAAGGTAYVAGATAGAIDVSGKLSDALPLFVAIIVVLALLLLCLAFRSVLVPLKAVLGFLLSIAASLGAVVWVFQYSHLGGVFQVAAPAPVVAFLPVLLIGVLFGLAMDYEVFLVSRIREHYHHGGDAREAIVHGIARSGRVVTAAALIMTAVFGGFIFNHDPIIKSIGFALTVGVLIDAFVVRLTVVPAVLALLGRHAWWVPRWLDRTLPNVDIEGADLPPRPDAPLATKDTGAAGPRG